MSRPPFAIVARQGVFPILGIAALGIAREQELLAHTERPSLKPGQPAQQATVD